MRHNARIQEIDLDHMITSAKDALGMSDNLTEKEYEYLVQVLENLRL
jgi:hypothetical protein